MQHQIRFDQAGPNGTAMASAVEACVHCGFCLPACPTYHLLGEEMDSPRGRIFLMKEVLEGKLKIDQAMPYIDRCLGCVGCVPACPSGVKYGQLLTSFRGLAEPQRRRSMADRFFRRILLATLPYPGRFRWALRAGACGRPFRRWLPGRLRGMLDLLPDRLPADSRLPEVYAAEGARRARVALLAGCAQQVLAPSINQATLRVLARNGVEVVIPQRQTCCGALAAHTGALAAAKKCANQNLAAFPADVDAVVTNAAGCGSGMQEYGLWLAGEENAAEGQRFAQRVVDVSKFLVDLGTVTHGSLDQPLQVAYHDACHLAHAQHVMDPPRQLIRNIENVQLLEIPEGHLCCGSAGTYNIEQPGAASELGRRKAEAIATTQADLVVTGNIGCLIQVRAHLAKRPQNIPVMHTMELLDRAYPATPAAGR
ncbi:MAG: 4Fe-4S dicluster domain-containing protein [Planctomycetales bacterium]|nr:4Fe-4S dicluster domain-containing protein [Planctomycetales bacterium]NIM09965.1 4Fe-4S dicluster domain-containing protein [Planctomycetales bacterium]NIN09403.1 4Fe-4S dicluster domain-containing protein [Planctomycetales bacterium]NIN78510.1 4Fe-4S dicluster domain-containing protein [Planctomycetales bacterium]NIO35703.1 4Fe-4S dicluster domain-containing protein [Planctomycetales bacterium]